MELLKISYLQTLSNATHNAFADRNFEYINKTIEGRLVVIRLTLKTVRKVLQKEKGLLCLYSLNQLKEGILKYGLQQLEFLVNEVMASDLQGIDRKRYITKLAEDVLEYLPNSSGYKEWQSFVKDAEIKIDRKREIEVIVDSLLLNDLHNSERVSIVPILGMAGTGKTSLARLVYYHQRVESHFDQKIWIDFSDLLTEQHIINKLQNKLGEGKCLLVIGDLPDNQDFEEWLVRLPSLLLAIDKCKHGTKILVTSRTTFIEPHLLPQLPMAKDAPYLLKPLHLNESLVYFQSIAFKGIAEQARNPRLVNIGLEIVSRCANNLHTIKIIASILSSEPENLEKWHYFTNTLLAEVENPVEYILSAAELMEDEFTNHRLILHYSSLFPLDYEFSRLVLQQLYEVQGLPPNREPSVKEFDDYFEKLLEKKYFIQSNKGYNTSVIDSYNAQRLMHEVVKHLASHNYRLVNKSTTEVDAQHVSFIIDSSWEAPSWLYDAKLLKCLLFLPSESCRFITIPNINNILVNLKSLQALDLATVTCRSCPDSIRELKHLRYLRLGTSFESLPECITNLKYLHTLDLRHSAILQLPESFYQLCSLRHLFTGGTLIDLPPRFGELEKLQTLDVFIVGKNNGLDALYKLSHLAGKLKVCYKEENYLWPNVCSYFGMLVPNTLSYRNIDDLSLVWSCLNEDPDADVEQERNIKEFEFLKPPYTLKRLAVQGCKGFKFRHTPCFSSLSSLESLQLRGLNALEWIEICEDIGKPRSSSTKYFPSLKTLILVNLPHLETWSKPEDHDVDCQQQNQYIPQKVFNCLSELKISGCPKLMSMPLVPNLEKLEVCDIHERLLKHLLSTQESPASSLSASSTSPALKELHIKSIHELESFSITITSLKLLTVKDCKELTNMLVVPSNSIKQLKIQACPRLKGISRALHSLSVLEKLEIESCEELDWVDRMDAIQKNGDDSVGAASQGLNKLHSLTVANMSKLEPLPRGLISCLKTLKELSLCWLYSLIFLPESIGHLIQLRRLVIRCCPKLRKLPKSIPNLKSLIVLEIKECPMLEKRCKQPYGQDFNLIEQVPNIHLGKLHYAGRSSNH